MPFKLTHIQPPILTPWIPNPNSPSGMMRNRVRPDGSPLQIGDAWYEPEFEDYGDGSGPQRSPYHLKLSRQYDEQHRGRRLPIVVCLPWRTSDGGLRPLWHCIDSHYWGSSPNPERNGWLVTGSLEAGDLTVAPSINIVGLYHGFIQNGVIGDDLDRRGQ